MAPGRTRRLHQNLSQGRIKVEALVQNFTGFLLKPWRASRKRKAVSSAKVGDKHLKGLRALAEKGAIKTLIIVAFEDLEHDTADGIRLLQWQGFLDRLWSDQGVFGA
jgi:hypothetical protein